MDPVKVSQLVAYLKDGKLPAQASQTQKDSLRRRAASYSMIDGELHYLCRRRKGMVHWAKVVSSAEEASSLFVQFHASDIGGHCGWEKTHRAILVRHYWPGMEEDIKRWIKECPQCQKRRSNLKQKVQYQPIEVTEPFELVGMDLVGKLTKSKSGYQYICVLVDYFTKWAEAYPLRTKTAEEVTGCILSFFYRFGAPKRILTDRGTEFRNKLNASVCSKLGIERSLCAPYHPQTNGLVEKLNGTIQGCLNAMVRNHPSRWEECLQPTMFALRTKMQLTTRESPYFLLFGREARYPPDIPEDYRITEEGVIALVQNQEVCGGLKSQADTYEEVRRKVKRSQEKTQAKRLRTGHDDCFKEGDLVLLRNIRQEQRKGGKLESDMLGPYKLLQLQGKSADLKAPNGATKLRVNVDHLCPYIVPQPRIPANLKVKVEEVMAEEEEAGF